MMKNLILILLLAAAVDEKGERLLRDATLVVPCRGAETILLGEPGENPLPRYNASRVHYRKFKVPGELFRDVFAVRVARDVRFDEVRYAEDRRVAWYAAGGTVVAIVSRNRDRITSDMVSLSRGLDHCVFRYGNDDAAITAREQHKIVLYPGKGLALIDDNGDDIIDMYVVFICQ